MVPRTEIGVLSGPVLEVVSDTRKEEFGTQHGMYALVVAGSSSTASDVGVESGEAVHV